MSSFSLQYITDKEQWEKFLAQRPEANFLQSWNWGVFHERLGKKVFRVGFFEDSTMVAAALCVTEKAKRGTYLTIAGGPLLDWKNTHLLSFVCEELKKVAQKEECVFVRIRPQEIESNELRAQVAKLGFVEAPMHLTADLTLQLDLTKSEEELLAEMRKNTRYEVRRVAKEEIIVKTSTSEEDIKEFYKHQLALATKHNFVPFSYEFLYEQFRTFAEDNQVVLFHAYKNDQLLASAFIIFYHQEAVYHYGISTPANDRLPGSYACQWAAIQWAKANGGLHYNFWGIAPQDKPDHRFAGVSLFKRGFGGQEVQYLPAHDLAVNWKYGATRTFELVRKKMRKL
jgi:lipid II:glycine glycyltransferase (peptidoglycan interpeptide bridge formation enzyme)